MRKNKEYIIAGSLLSLAVVGMVFAYQSESDDKKAKEQNENQVAFQEVEEDKEEDKDEVKDVSNILSSKKADDKELNEPKADDANEAPTQETAATAKTLKFNESLVWPTDGKVLMNYSMNQTIYFASLDQYRYNPAVIIGADVNDEVKSAADGIILDITNNEVTGCTVKVDLGSGYTAVYGQLKEVTKQAGDSIGAGEVFGYISEPTKYYSVEGSNLYFELQKDQQPIDPMTFFQ